jgi:hypothetical protein
VTYHRELGPAPPLAAATPRRNPVATETKVRIQSCHVMVVCGLRERRAKIGVVGRSKPLSLGTSSGKNVAIHLLGNN